MNGKTNYVKQILDIIKTMNRKETRLIILRVLKEAIASLYIHDKRNIDMRVNEMNLCSRLAHYLEIRFREYGCLFDGYYADTEYNRGFGSQKKYILYNDRKLHSVRCDLLIHSRGLKNPDNLLALEMKKEGVDTNVVSDHDRLENIVKPRTDETPADAVCDTLLGVFLEIRKSGYVLTEYWYDEGDNSIKENVKIKLTNVTMSIETSIKNSHLR